MRKIKKSILGGLLLAVSLVLVACSSGPKGTYKGSMAGSDVTFTTDGKKATMTAEANILGFKSSSTEEGTIDTKTKTFKSDKNVYDYTQDGDTLTLTAKGVTVKLTKEK